MPGKGRGTGLFVLALAAAVGLPGVASAGWHTHIYGSHYEAAQTETDQVPESSGVVASRLSPDVYWTHNDSGHPPRLWVFRLNAADEAAGSARNLGYVDLPAASSSDWEDIATGPGDMIHVFDGGDNPPCSRTDKRIHRFVEPAIDPNGAPVVLSAAYESIRFEYPDSTDPAQPADTDAERYDCEALALHPLTGDLYFITKRNNSSLPVSRAYKLSAAELSWGSEDVHVLELLADLSATIPSYPTSMDIDTDGHRMIVRNYTTAYEFTLPTGQPFEDILQTTPIGIGLSGEPKGEGICYHMTGGDFITTSENLGSGAQPISVYRTPWLLANVAASDVTMASACITWQTRAMLNSRVDHGETMAYGYFEADPTAVTLHRLNPAGRLPQTRYYYKVSSGTLAFPAPADADTVYLESADCRAADFDNDGDTGLDDLAEFQRCFAGECQPGGQSCTVEADFGADGDVDLYDLAALLTCLAGPHRLNHVPRGRGQDRSSLTGPF